MMTKINILMLYDANSTHIKTIKDYLLVFKKYSKFNFVYAHATHAFASLESMDQFDAVMINFSVRLSLDDHISEKTANALIEYQGPKFLFIQDEYDTTETARKWIEKLKIDFVYTCVPELEIEKIYPRSRFPNTQFKQILTGYVPDETEVISEFSLPLAERKNVICYRGRQLPFWYGELGYEKYYIGEKMREICNAKHIPCDIETDDYKRIYGYDWYRFIGSARATLASESGSNLFDFDGEVRKYIENKLKENPNLQYAEVRDYLIQFENLVQMNQISPKVFEAIALRTALILFEGSYSNVLKPNIHYIPLRKDFSNIEDVLQQVHDDARVTSLTEAAYRDIIESKQYSYAQFIAMVDNDIASLICRKPRLHINKIQRLLVTKNPIEISEFNKLLLLHQRKIIFKNGLFKNKRLLLSIILKKVVQTTPLSLRRAVGKMLPAQIKRKLLSII